MINTFKELMSIEPDMIQLDEEDVMELELLLK